MRLTSPSANAPRRSIASCVGVRAQPPAIGAPADRFARAARHGGDVSSGSIATSTPVTPRFARLFAHQARGEFAAHRHRLRADQRGRACRCRALLPSAVRHAARSAPASRHVAARGNAARRSAMATAEQRMTCSWRRARIGKTRAASRCARQRSVAEQRCRTLNRVRNSAQSFEDVQRRFRQIQRVEVQRRRAAVDQASAQVARRTRPRTRGCSRHRRRRPACACRSSAGSPRRRLRRSAAAG